MKKHSKFAVSVGILLALLVVAAPIEVATAIGLAAAERAVKVFFLKR